MCKISLLFFILFSLFTLTPLIPTTLFGKDTDKKDHGLDLTLEAISILRSDSIKEKKDSNNTLNVMNKKVVNITKKVTHIYNENSNIDSYEYRTERPDQQNTNRSYPIVSNLNKNDNNTDKINLKLSTPKQYMATIPSNKPWARTGVYIRENDIIKIICSGKVMPGAFERWYKNTSCLAEGFSFTRGSSTVLPNANYMSAIGKIGDREAFYIGSGREFISYVSGPLYLGINELAKSVYTGKPIRRNSSYWRDNTGCYEASIYVYR